MNWLTQKPRLRVCIRTLALVVALLALLSLQLPRLLKWLPELFLTNHKQSNGKNAAEPTYSPLTSPQPPQAPAVIRIDPDPSEPDRQPVEVLYARTMTGVEPWALVGDDVPRDVVIGIEKLVHDAVISGNKHIPRHRLYPGFETVIAGYTVMPYSVEKEEHKERYRVQFLVHPRLSDGRDVIRTFFEEWVYEPKLRNGKVSSDGTIAFERFTRVVGPLDTVGF